MLQPKRQKYRRPQKGKMKGNAFRGHQIAFGSFGIKTLEEAWITARQIEAARQAVTPLFSCASAQETRNRLPSATRSMAPAPH